jgi:TolB-like protein/predicted Zn-dependent protease
VLYEMLAGEPPYTGATQQAVLAKRLTEPVPRVSTLRQVSPAVEQAVTRALARAPADRFTTAADFAAALTSADSVPTVVTPPAVRRAGPPIRLRLLLGAAAAVLLVATAIFAWRDRPAPAPARQAPPASAAVLPFTNLSADKDQEHFSDGLTEELITALSQVPGLRVAPRSSSFQFKGREPDVREVGRMLDVGTVLEGSVRRSGNRLRVSAQLVSVKQNSQLWAESYDRDLADVFAVQEDIARAIVAALRVRLAPDRPTVVASPTRDLEAYDLYLKGRFAWNQRTAASLPQAARYFEQAVGRDSGMARGYAGLADAELLLPLYTDAKPEAEWPRAKAAALRALALDSTLADAHTSLAYGTLLYEWNWRAAEASFGRAIASDSAYATAHHWYADFLAGRGRLDESLREMRRAHQLDPLSRIVATELAWVQYLQHRTADARAEIDRVLALDPGFAHAYFVRGLIELQAGRPVEAVASFRRNIEIGGFYAYTNGVLCYALARSGDRAAAERELAEMLARRKTQYVPPFGLAMAYAGLGDRSQAIGWLERGIAERDILMPENFFDPLFDSLVGDPRFAAVERRLGLTPRKAGR